MNLDFYFSLDFCTARPVLTVLWGLVFVFLTMQLFENICVSYMYIFQTAGLGFQRQRTRSALKLFKNSSIISGTIKVNYKHGNQKAGDTYLLKL